MEIWMMLPVRPELETLERGLGVDGLRNIFLTRLTRKMTRAATNHEIYKNELRNTLWRNC
jgi:hypothetical protein